MSDRAPLPWSSVANSWQYTTIYDANSNHICRLDLEDWHVTEENQDALEKEQARVAALIVTAANSHAHLIKALEASCGYLLNAKIDLESGCTKATAIKTIEGGLLRAKAVLAIVGAVMPKERS